MQGVSNAVFMFNDFIPPLSPPFPISPAKVFYNSDSISFLYGKFYSVPGPAFRIFLVSPLRFLPSILLSLAALEGFVFFLGFGFSVA